MRLTQLLFKPKPKFHGPGRWVGSGKRRVNILGNRDVYKAKEDLKVEEMNMLYLRYPYLTFEQSFNHSNAYGKHKAFYARMYLENQKIEPDVTIEKRFSALQVKDVWDC